MNFKTNNGQKQNGQSLIETIVAIYLLTMALTTGLGLAIYAYSLSGVSQSEIVASNLAREGIDVVRMMRDSNWLAGDASGVAANNLTACADLGAKSCYPNAFTGPAYSLADGNWRADFNVTSKVWSLALGNYNLFLQSDGTYTSTDPGNGTISNYARQINISRNTAAPYTANNPELIVTSVVAWRGKKCTTFTNEDPLTLATTCKVSVEEHLTNWKDYQ